MIHIILSERWMNQFYHNVSKFVMTPEIVRFPILTVNYYVHLTSQLARFFVCIY